MRIFIYGLCERDKSIYRYIGKTNKKDLQKRLKEHINESFRKGGNTYKNNWIRSIINRGGEIDIKCIEEVNEENWEEREKYWILKHNNLTNITEGGEGGHGIIYNLSYDECKKIIQEKYNIKSKNEWYKNINNLDNNIPRNPRNVFLNKGWVSWGDFLGTGRKQDNLLANDYLSYNDAKQWVKNNLKVKSAIVWKQNIKENIIPKNIPNRPDRYYKKRGWVSWGDFLSTGKIANQYKKHIFLSYEDACKFVIKNKIKSKKEYINFNLPTNLPSSPDKYYKEWKTWGDFLGTGREQDNLLAKDYLSYNDAKQWVKNNLKVKSKKDWEEKVKHKIIPFFIPNHPELYYYRKERGWLGWKDFLSKPKKDK